MTRKEQRKFIKDCLASCEKSLLKLIPETPTDWEGHELRLWISDYFQAHYACLSMGQSHKRKYHQAICVDNPNLI